MANWIKCSEWMPELHKQVLVCDENKKVFICCYAQGYWRDYRVGNSFSDITYWQPLPEPPQE